MGMGRRKHRQDTLEKFYAAVMGRPSLAPGKSVL